MKRKYIVYFEVNDTTQEIDYTNCEDKFWWMRPSACQYIEATETEISLLIRFAETRFGLGVVRIRDIEENRILIDMYEHNISKSEFYQWTNNVKRFKTHEALELCCRYNDFLTQKNNTTLRTPLGNISLTNVEKSSPDDLNVYELIKNRADWKKHVVPEHQHIVENALKTIDTFRQACIKHE